MMMQCSPETAGRGGREPTAGNRRHSRYAEATQKEEETSPGVSAVPKPRPDQPQPLRPHPRRPVGQERLTMLILILKQRPPLSWRQFRVRCPASHQVISTATAPNSCKIAIEQNLPSTTLSDAAGNPTRSELQFRGFDLLTGQWPGAGSGCVSEWHSYQRSFWRQCELELYFRPTRLKMSRSCRTTPRSVSMLSVARPASHCVMALASEGRRV